MKRRTIRIALHIAFWCVALIWFVESVISQPAEWVLCKIGEKIDDLA